MNQSRQHLGALFVLAVAGPTFGDWTQNPTSGHWYQLTPPGMTWQQAEDWAVTNGGHLVTINDSAENDWVQANFVTASTPNILWIGLYQLASGVEPSGGWVWASGETSAYFKWATAAGQPDDGSTGEDFAHMIGCCNNAPNMSPGFWNDADPAPPLGFGPGIVERGVDSTVPTVSTWGVAVMALLTLAAGTVVLRGKRANG